MAASGIPDKAAYLASLGLVRDGDSAFLAHKLPEYVPWVEDSPEFRGALVIREGKVLVQREVDSAPRALSAIAIEVINKYRPEGPRPSAAGGEHWGTRLESFASWADRIVPPSSHDKRFHWTREEAILALELYFRVPLSRTDEQSRDVIELSNVLRSLSIHPRPWPENFRNPNSVFLRLTNFAHLDPDYEGEGMSGVSQLVRDVWEEFHGDHDALRHRVQAILAGTTIEDAPDLEEATEGRIVSRLHTSRERNGALVRKAKERFKNKHGRLYCEVCGFDFEATYGVRGEGFIEAHHKVPVSELDGSTRTRVEDLAMLCANCHRMVHARRPWLSVDELLGLAQAQIHS